MRLLLSLFLFASLALTGCAELLIQPDDSRATTAAKVAARVPMAVATIGVSEMAYACARGDWPETEGITRGSPAALAACAPEGSEYDSGFDSGWGPHNSTFGEWVKDQEHHRKGHDHHHGDC